MDDRAELASELAARMARWIADPALRERHVFDGASCRRALTYTQHSDMNLNRKRRTIAVCGTICVTGLIFYVVFPSAKPSEIQSKPLTFNGIERRPNGKVAKFLFTNTRGTQVMLSRWEKESLDSNVWTPLEGVYGDIWFEENGRTNVGNPTINPGGSLNILVLEPATAQWRLSFASATRKPFLDELKLRLNAAWKEKRPSLLFTMRAFENGITIVSDTFSKDSSGN